ncbi:MAG: epoxyqueuosine reductase QueH [Ruminococcus flavefaciens]|nr:epoxyqueuosine reductase QueH [Ruminococcus flavefaciens]MCM1228501.1 epoxyqueuosine reductase QueH [Ruminococcus flavefaciens]
MQKINYGKMLDDKLAELKKSGKKPTLLLHSCCAPCSSHTLLYLYDFFDITVYFCNPNIAPEEEYNFRKSELKRLISELDLAVEIIDEDYNPEPFYELAKGLENLPERGERCQKCIAYRLRKTAELAVRRSADYFTTTLTISPHKDCGFINRCGSEIADELGAEWLFSDFKKHDGYKHSIQLSAQYNLYRQNYCGCVYSRKASGNG